MGKKGSPTYDIFKDARNRACINMKAYYPDVPRKSIHKHDPILWAIIYAAAVKEAKEKRGHIDRDQRAVAEKQRGPDGRFGSLPRR